LYNQAKHYLDIELQQLNKNRGILKKRSLKLKPL